MRSWCAGSRRSRSARHRAPRRRVSCSLRPAARAQRGPLERLTAATGLFRPDEVAIAVELLDDALAGDDDYRFLGAYAGDQLIGYACWGPTPGTTGTFDLYWIVVDPARQGTGLGTALLRAVEERLTTDNGRLIVVETSSRADYASTRAFPRVASVRRVLPVLHAPTQGGRPQEDPHGRARVGIPLPRGARRDPRRNYVGRGSPAPLRSAHRRALQAPAGHPAHRGHPHRQPGAMSSPRADHTGVVRAAEAIPSALHQHPLQSPRRANSP